LKSPALKSAVELDDITALIGEDLARVERVLHEGMRSVAPLISEIGDYTLDGGGKRIRPVLVLLAARLCGYRGPRAIQVAAAAEFLHTATLVHDDVVDGATTRRGRPSVNARFGTRLAILMGDYLLATSSQMLVEDGNNDILAAYTDTIRRMAEGEVLQLTRSFDPEISESLYIDVIGRKTATLLATAAESGAVLGDVTRSERRAVREYGWQLGVAFQLVDDALDYIGDGDELGKAPLADLAEGKVTMPLIATLKRCSVAEREALVTALKSLSGGAATGAEPDRDALMQVADYVRRYDGAELTLERALQHSREACAKIAPFADCEAKEALYALAEFVVRRKT
jgi:octaprenyl-diphosphate synthase